MEKREYQIHAKSGTKLDHRPQVREGIELLTLREREHLQVRKENGLGGRHRIIDIIHVTQSSCLQVWQTFEQETYIGESRWRSDFHEDFSQVIKRLYVRNLVI